ncbi:MAG: kelch repeat-containing protein [Ardenticatenaceae bacterium]|nr:kelch repeat-containing protein [Ardenticatenaceae bacterium]
MTGKQSANLVIFTTFTLLMIVTSWALAAPLAPCPDISPLECSAVKLLPDQTFAFDGTDGGLTDKNGVQMGFTMVDPPDKPGNPAPNPDAPGYWPENLEITGGNLVISTTFGLAYQNINRQDNALGIGLDLGQPVTLKTTVINLPPAPGGFAQAGLWFGKSGIGPSGLGGTGSAENDYIKLVAISDDVDSWRVQALREDNAVAVSSTGDAIDGAQPITLWLELTPSLREVKARYCSGLNCPVESAVVLQTFTNVPGEWFSTDQAGIDFNVGTRSMGGILASHRNAPASQLFTFTEFVYESGVATVPIGSLDGVDFETWRISDITQPTAMAWGPDDRLYVISVSGTLYALTIDHATNSVTNQQTFANVLGEPRLALGLAVDPASTPSNVILWVGHSDIDQAAGDANSGTITKLSGANFSTVENVITGLPRAIANHATNNIHFGPDGRLYIAQGGNTGAGAPNDGASEFGPRPEQPLAAALLVADVKNPSFDGSCTSQIDPDGSTMDATGVAARDVPCDVETFATGLRNTYDFAFHPNGSIYAPDNGLGVVGTIPDLPVNYTPGDNCDGFASSISSNNPGDRPDILNRIVEGGFYGHPNPSRDECVFYGGNPTANPDFPLVPDNDALDTDIYDVGVQPYPGWSQPIFGLGRNHSANGTIAYNSGGQAFCGQLDGDLLINYFNLDDQITRLTLSNNGASVIEQQTLIRSSAQAGGQTLSNPLPITQDPAGNIYVGEFGTSGVTIFEPLNVGLWYQNSRATLPTALLDAGSAVVNDILYAAAGKTSGGYQRALYAYDYDANGWTQRADLPAAYPAVENPAAAAYNGKLYLFGGSTSPFSGAVNNAAVYDPGTNQWTLLTSMPTARGGATAQVVDGNIYVIGGMNGSGDSVTTVEVYDPVGNSWSSAPDMGTARDNPGSAELDGKIYVFGGRTRSGGTTQNGTLSSSEVFEPGVSSDWTNISPMPTGRRTFSTVPYNGKILVMGGEKTDDDMTFTATEAYDPATNSWSLLTQMPTGRHGAVYGVIGDAVIVGGGGVVGGSSFTGQLDVFSFSCLDLTGGYSLWLPYITR